MTKPKVKRAKVEIDSEQQDLDDGLVSSQVSEAVEGKDLSTKSEPHIRDIIVPKSLTDVTYCKIISWNVAGIRGILKNNPDILNNLVLKHNPDILCLQETKLQTSDGFEQILPGYNSFWTCSESKKGYSGTAVFIRKNIPLTFDTSQFAPKKPKQATLSGFFKSKPNDAVQSKDNVSSADPPHTLLSVQSVKYELDESRFQGEGRTITVDLGMFTIVACYVPNSGQTLERLNYRIDEWEPAMRKYLSDLKQKKPVVFIGDLNVGHLDLDIHNPTAKHISKQSGLTPQERNAMSVLLKCGFTDSFRYLYPDARGIFTYWSQRTFARPVNKGIRLDYFLCSDDMIGCTNSKQFYGENDSAESSLTASSKKGKRSREESTNETKPEPRMLNPIDEEIPIPGVYDSYMLHSDTIGLSDHCPIVLLIKLA